MGELKFTEEGHIYHHDPPVDGLTNMIKSFGFITHKASQGYLDRGTAIHFALQLLDENDLDEDGVDPQIRPWIEGYKRFKEDTGFKPIRIEAMAHHDGYLFATRIDRDGKMNGDLVLLELKSGGKQEWWGWQLALQQIALQHEYKKRFALSLTGDGKYKLHPYHERRWLDEAQAILTVKSLRRNNGNK